MRKILTGDGVRRMVAIDKKKYLVSVSCVLIFIGSIIFQRPLHARKPIITLTIMKAGSHLLNKCISLLTQGKKFFYTGDLKPNLPQLLLKDNLFCYTHVAYTKTREQWLLKNKFTCFYMYRDPRDQLISLVFYLYVAPWTKSKVHPVFNKPMEHVPFNDLLMDLITDGSWLYNFMAHTSGIKSVNGFYKAIAPWSKMPGVCIVTFEELIGSRGGGSEELQLRSIDKIARHLGIKNTTRQKLQAVARELFGSSVSFGAQVSSGALEVARSKQKTFEHFRQGKIGAWKDYFTAEHKQAFKQRAGKLLIDLGYEKDLNW